MLRTMTDAMDMKMNKNAAVFEGSQFSDINPTEAGK